MLACGIWLSTTMRSPGCESLDVCQRFLRHIHEWRRRARDRKIVLAYLFRVFFVNITGAKLLFSLPHFLEVRSLGCWMCTVGENQKSRVKKNAIFVQLGGPPLSHSSVEFSPSFPPHSHPSLAVFSPPATLAWTLRRTSRGSALSGWCLTGRRQCSPGLRGRGSP